MLILFVMSILLYANTWNHGFTLDDTMMILENKYTTGGIEGLEKIFTTDAFAGFLGDEKQLLSGGRYRPLAQSIHNIEYSLMGLSPTFWHIQNTLFFGFALILFFIFIQKLIPNLNQGWTNVAFLSSLLAAAHPLNTEVVANIKSFDLLLSMVLGLGALIFMLRFFDHHRIKDLVLGSLLLFLAMLSKETAITLLAVLPIGIILFREKSTKHLLISSAAGLLAFVGYFALRTALVGLPASVEVNELLNNPFVEATTTQKYATLALTFGYYLKLISIPINLTHDYYPYTISLTNFSNLAVILSILIYLSMSVLSLYQLIYGRNKNPNLNILAFGWIFYISIFSISSNLLINVGAFMNERFIFIGFYGIILLLVFYLIQLLNRLNQNQTKTIYLIIIPLVLLLTAKTIDRNRAWADDYTLFTTDVKVSKGSAKCNVSAGGKTYEKAKPLPKGLARTQLLLDAEKYIQKGIEIHPKYIQAYILLGNVYFEMDSLSLAMVNYQKANQLGEKEAALINIKNVGYRYHQLKKHKESWQTLNLSLQHFKNDSSLLFTQADNLLNLNQVDSAKKLVEYLIKRQPDFDAGFNKLGEIYGRYLNNLPQSKLFLLKAIAINPKNSSALENLGVLYGIENQLDSSLFYFKKAFENNKKPNSELYYNLHIGYMRTGDTLQGKLMLEKATQKRKEENQ